MRKTEENSKAEAPTVSKPAAASHTEFVSLEEHDRILQLVRQPTASNERAALREALTLALEYWRHRQQRYKNRHPVWVEKATAALTTQQEAQPQAEQDSLAIEHLDALVTALSTAFISTWQSTAAWSQQLHEADRFLSEFRAARAAQQATGERT